MSVPPLESVSLADDGTSVNPTQVADSSHLTAPHSRNGGARAHASDGHGAHRGMPKRRQVARVPAGSSRVRFVRWVARLDVGRRGSIRDGPSVGGACVGRDLPIGGSVAHREGCVDAEGWLFAAGGSNYRQDGSTRALSNRSHHRLRPTPHPNV